MSGKLTIEVTNFRPLAKGSLLGFATIHIAEMRLAIADVGIHETNGKRWAALPSKPWIKDGRQVTGDDGKAKYSPLFVFDADQVRFAFSAAVIAALDRYKARDAA
jgi:hypothetical protein